MPEFRRQKSAEEGAKDKVTGTRQVRSAKGRHTRSWHSALSALLCPSSLRLGILLILLAGIGVAQVRPGDLKPQASGSKYYVWGQVRSPGAFSFLAAPDLFELISAAGGPTEDANLTRVIIIRAVSQTRTRINLQAALNKGELVRLSPGDVVMVPSSAWYRIRTGLTVFTTIVSMLTLP